MRIISPFKDYYDSLAGTTRDELPVYLRKPGSRSFEPIVSGSMVFSPETQALGEVARAFAMRPSWGHTGLRDSRVSDLLNVQSIFIVFCGEIHAYYVENGRYLSSLRYEAGAVFRTPAEMYEAVERGKVKPSEFVRVDHVLRALASEDGPTSQVQFKGQVNLSDTTYPYSDKGWAAWQARFNRPVSADVHRYFGSPVLRIRMSPDYRLKWVVETNPSLREAGFQRILSPEQAYQKLDQYLGNELANQPDPVPERTQELIRDAHGFDNNSFKNVKPDRRSRKRR